MEHRDGERPSGRIWDRYLTEQDRAAIRRKPNRSRGFGDRPALLLIDLYRSVFGDKPEPLLDAVETWPSSCGLAGWNALPHIQRLLAAARAAGIPVVHTRGSGNAGVKSRARGSLLAVRGEAPLAADDDRRIRGGEIIDDVAPVAGELVIRKSSASAFWGSPLVGHFIDLGVNTVIVGGESTSGCVRASVVDGNAYAFKMVVVEECVFDRHEAPHAIELFTMNEKYADVLPLTEVLSYLSEFSLPATTPASERRTTATV
jgi:nicotinamidase-related amidase